MVRYGYWHCGKVLLESSKEGTISIGGLEGVLVKEDDKGRVERKPLPISKMRSWRVGVLVSRIWLFSFLYYVFLHHDLLP